MTPQELEAIKARDRRYNLQRWSNDAARDRRALLREVERLQAAYDQLTGERFSDRVHAALKSRAAKAEAKVKRLREALTAAKVSHHTCEDCWYSCPLSEEGCYDERQVECNCGAEKHNAAIDAALSGDSTD